MCGVGVPEEHSHVVDVQARGLMCACRACYLLFTNQGAAHGRWRSVPDDAHVLDLELDEVLWEELQIPVGVAFFFTNSAMGRTLAFYPSPAGPTESLLTLGAWSQVVAANPVLATLAPDVEALLVRRLGPGHFASYLVPIDVCYQLVGLVRATWRGFDGGEAIGKIEDFFTGLEGRCRPLRLRAAAAAMAEQTGQMGQTG